MRSRDWRHGETFQKPHLPREAAEPGRPGLGGGAGEGKGGKIKQGRMTNMSNNLLGLSAEHVSMMLVHLLAS